MDSLTWCLMLVLAHVLDRDCTINLPCHQSQTTDTEDCSVQTYVNYLVWNILHFA